jgi:hypothetical protein
MGITIKRPKVGFQEEKGLAFPFVCRSPVNGFRSAAARFWPSLGAISSATR